MDQQAHADPAGELTLKWETMGLEDRPVEQARTITVRTRRTPTGHTPRELAERLPNLFGDEDPSSLPELDIKGTIGEGGMGRVELAEQIPLGRDVAVKKVRDDADSEMARMVVLREGWTTGQLEHPNIVPVHTLGRDDDGTPLIVMKKIAGTSWLDIIDDPSRAPDAFESDDPVDLHVEILLQILNAVAYAHSRGIIHRDLKPDNVMLGEFGEVYLLDWGIAVSLKPDPSGRLHSIEDVDQPAGTPAYMAPEMVEGDGTELGIHSDIFLLGATLYEALSGTPPYDGETLYQMMIRAYRCEYEPLDESVPPELRAICRRAMAADPKQRFDDARQMRNALVDFRRQRQSRRLAATGDARLIEVQRLLKQEQQGDEIDERLLYRTFGECRFAYEQALEINADNRRATESLQKALEMMAERALENDAYKAASLLISDLPEPSPGLQQRLDRLEEKLSDRRRDYEELQQIRRNIDVDIGRGGRVIFMIILGGAWLLMTSAAIPLLVLGIFEMNYPRLLGHIVMLTVGTAVITYVWRDYFVANEIDRRMLTGLITLFSGGVIHRGMSWAMEIPFREMIATEMLVYAVGAAAIAVSLDRRIIGAAIPFGLGGFIAAFWPELAFWLLAAANLVTVVTMTWLWWPDNPREELRRLSDRDCL